MKIGVVITERKHHEVSIPPKRALDALRAEITWRINDELRSLKLPDSELSIPLEGFQMFYVTNGVLRAYHEEGRHPRNTETDIEIKWGVSKFKRMVMFQEQLYDMDKSGFLDDPA